MYSQTASCCGRKQGEACNSPGLLRMMSESANKDHSFFCSPSMEKEQNVQANALLRANTRRNRPAFWVSGCPAIRLTDGLTFDFGIYSELWGCTLVCCSGTGDPRPSGSSSKLRK